MHLQISSALISNRITDECVSGHRQTCRPPNPTSASAPKANSRRSSGHVGKVPQRTNAPQYRLVVHQIEFAGMDRSSLQSSSACAFAATVISTASARRRWLLEPHQSRRNRGSAADSHPADSPAMAVPETLCHPFATAKIVVWPGTCSVRGGIIIAARSRDATLCACGRRGERTGNRCDRDKGSKCLLHSRPPVLAGRAATAPPKTPRNSRRCTSIPRRTIVSGQQSALIGAGFELLVCKVLMSGLGH